MSNVQRPATSNARCPSGTSKDLRTNTGHNPSFPQCPRSVALSLTVSGLAPGAKSRLNLSRYAQSKSRAVSDTREGHRGTDVKAMKRKAAKCKRLSIAVDITICEL